MSPTDDYDALKSSVKKNFEQILKSRDVAEATKYRIQSTPELREVCVATGRDLRDVDSFLHELDLQLLAYVPA